MAHLRTDIRYAASIALASGRPAGWTVVPDRGRPVADRTVTIGIAAETIERRGGTGKPDKRVMALDVTVNVFGAMPDDLVDAACIWVEQAMADDPTLGGVAEDCIHRETRIDVETGGESPFGRAVLTYDIRAAKALDTF